MAKHDDDEPKPPNAVTVATDLAMYGWDRVHGGDGVAYAVVAGVCVPLEARAFSDALRGRFWRKESYAPPPTAISTAIEMAAADTRAQPTRPIWNRAGGSYDDGVFLALYDDEGRYVRVGVDGWRMVTPLTEGVPGALFMKPGDALPLPEPERGGSLDELRPFVNVATEADWLLLVAWLLGVMMPRGPYPLLGLTGEAGSGKSRMARVLRAVVDPSRASDRGAPRDLDAVIAAARHCRVLPLDNLSYIGNDMSDLLCRVASGGSVGARALYTNYDEATVQLERPIIINGITDLVARGDLASRTIALSLPLLPRRLDEQAMDDAFREAHPRILGALLDACVVALQRREGVELGEDAPRMAGFARWIEAAAPALGAEPGEFLKAYGQNRLASTRVVLDSDPLASRLVQLAVEGFDGTASQLLEAIGSPAGSDKGWPRTPNVLSGKVRRLAGALRDIGIDCTIRRTKKGAAIMLSVMAGADVEAEPLPPTF